MLNCGFLFSLLQPGDAGLANLYSGGCAPSLTKVEESGAERFYDQQALDIDRYVSSCLGISL